MTLGIINSGKILTTQPNYTPWTSTSLTYGFYTNYSSLPATYGSFKILYAPASGPIPSYSTPGLVASLDPATEIPWVKSFLDPSLNSSRYIGNFTELTFAQATSPASATIAFGALTNYSTPSAEAWSSFGSSAASGIEAGDIWLTQNARAGAAGRPANWFNHAVIHELGHALGLSHSFTNGPGRPPLAGFTAQENNEKFSIMSYQSHTGEASHVFEFQLYDIAALQHLYGRKDVVANTVYKDFHASFSASGAYIVGGAVAATAADRIFSIWDGGGTDTIDAGTYIGKSAYIDLRPGHFSSIGPNAFANNGNILAMI
jgi:Peptidase M10 serralysin C terminal/Metallo-peptidase family M12B Reprolysin-like